MPNIQFSVLIKWVKYVTISFLIECIWHKSVPFSSHCCYLSSVLTRSTMKPRWDPLLQLFLQFQQKSSNFQNRWITVLMVYWVFFCFQMNPKLLTDQSKPAWKSGTFQPYFVSHFCYVLSWTSWSNITWFYLSRPHTIPFPSPLHNLSRFMPSLFLFIALYPCPQSIIYHAINILY